MNRLLCLVALAVTSCEAPIGSPASPALPAAAPAIHRVSPADDGTFMEQIDPLGGQWRVQSIGGEDFRQYKGWINFSDGGFLNHGAGCSGGYPAFYRLAGRGLAITRREAVRIGKCASSRPANAAAAATSERRLASFLDQAAAWDRPDRHSLVLTARDGTRAILARPVEPHPDLAGRWIIETIGGRPLVTERRPPILTISMGHIGVVADCNSMGAPVAIPAPGRIAVTTPIIGTAIGCGPEDSAEDALMTSAMTSATAYRIDGDRLLFTGGPGMVLRRPPPPDRRLAGEYQSCGNTLLGGYHEGPITLSIEGSRMKDNAGCTARYRSNGPQLVIELDDIAACAAGSPPFVPGEPVPVGGAISTLAVTRPDGFAFTEEGRLILRTHRGMLNMCRKGSPPPFGG